jgi:lipoate-protein ligase B
VLVLNLGCEPYQRIWELQHALVEARRDQRIDDVLLLLEHEPTITLGRNADSAHILASDYQLRSTGITVHRVERGGDVTYHGPGQLVGYPILSLADHHLAVADYMHLLEETVIRSLSDLGLQARRRQGLIGVWIGDRKVAALGARVQHGVTFHGLAINVAPNLAHFELIVPCGLSAVEITSMQKELGATVDMSAVRQRTAFNLCMLLGVPQRQVTLPELMSQAGIALPA